MAQEEAAAGFAELLTALGRRVLDEVDPEEEPLAAATRLRRTYPADLVARALTQGRLRGRGAEKFGADAARMFFTPDGLEQATRAEVAAHRAVRFGGLGLPVADLCCGIGADLVALARAGVPVTGVERDSLTADVARANIEALGLADRASVRLGDAAAFAPDGFAVFCDPGRRAGSRRIFDPEAYEPPLSTALDLAVRGTGGCVKVAPGVPHEIVPDGAEAEWVSWKGDLKEAVIWTGALAGPGVRRATLLPTGATLTGDPGLGPPPVAPARRFLYEPDDAVIRAHLVAECAAGIDGALLDPAIAYITADRHVPTPYARAYEITDVLPFAAKRLRAVLRERGVGRVTIKKRGSAVDIERLRAQLKLSGDAETTVVLTRLGDRPYALLADPVRVPGRGGPAR